MLPGDLRRAPEGKGSSGSWFLAKVTLSSVVERRMPIAGTDPSGRKAGWAPAALMASATVHLCTDLGCTGGGLGIRAPWAHLWASLEDHPGTWSVRWKSFRSDGGAQGD